MNLILWFGSWTRGTPQSSPKVGFSIINHPAIGSPVCSMEPPHLLLQSSRVYITGISPALFLMTPPFLGDHLLWKAPFTSHESLQLGSNKVSCPVHPDPIHVCFTGISWQRFWGGRISRSFGLKKIMEKIPGRYGNMMKYAAFRYGFYQKPWRHVSPKSSNILHFYWEKQWFWVHHLRNTPMEFQTNLGGPLDMQNLHHRFIAASDI